MLGDNRATLDRIAEALLERETLDRGELDLLLQGKTLPPLPLPVADPPAVASADADADADTEKPTSFSGDSIPDPEPVPG
jgi:cell division protease FtsH